MYKQSNELQIKLATYYNPTTNTIVFPYWFNDLIGPNLLPQTLTHLTFGHGFNQPLNKDVLPNSLTHLVFGDTYNHKFEPNVLPSNLIYLTFSKNSEYNQAFESNVFDVLL